MKMLVYGWPILARFVIVGWLIIPLSFTQAGGNKPLPFSKICFGLQLGNKIGLNDLDEFWDTGPAAGVALKMPFYWGLVEGGIQRIKFASLQTSIPNFKSDFLYLGWGIEKHLAMGITLMGGLKLGGQIMSFENSAGDVIREIEMGTELYSSLGFALNPTWSFSGSFRHQRIYTQRAIRIDLISLTLIRSTTTPNWLRIMLQ